MVEVIYNKKNAETTKTENLIRLPKNIRQVGVAGNHLKIYMEDYVQSYIRRFSVCQEDACFVLFGKTIYATDRQYIFISGAIRVVEENIFHQKMEVHAEAWEKLRIAAREFFPDLEQVGWANTRDNLSAYDTEITHRRFFSEKKGVYYHSTENEEEFYTLSSGMLKKEDGYYIYFSPNEAMQNYMIESREEKETVEENEVPEETMVHFRTIMRERKEAVEHRRTIAYLSCASTFLVILVMAIGITMINNYEKMREMETTLAGISTMLSGDTETMVAQEENIQEEMKTTVELSEGAGHVMQNDKGVENEITESAAEETETVEKEEAVAGEEVADVAEVEEEITEATEELIIEETAPEEVTEKSEELVIEETAPENAAEKPEAAVEASSAGNTYVVKRGDTLAKISWKFYQTADMVDEICELNQIENRDIILYGKEILLP